MFHVGDLIIYTAHGICQIDDICEKTYADVTRTYYVLHPVDNSKLIISIPVDYESPTILKMMDNHQAEQILASFQLPGVEWIEKTNQRTHEYGEIVFSGKREEIAKVLNTLMRKKHEAETHGKKLGSADHKLLSMIQKILFEEIAIALDTTYDVISDRVTKMIANNCSNRFRSD